MAADELRQAAGARQVEARAQRADPEQLVDVDRPADALDAGLTEVAQLEVAVDEAGGVLGEIHAAGLADLLHAGRQTDDVPLRRVVHAQVVPDLSDGADDHLAGVATDAHREAQPALRPQVIGLRPQLLLQLLGELHRALDVGEQHRHLLALAFEG